MGISKAGTMTGWKLKTWAQKNKETIKLIIVASIGVATYVIANEIPVGWREALAGIVTLFGKLAADSFDFWISDVQIPKA
jgi:hypothetical protein